MDCFLDAHATNRRRALQLAAAGAGIAGFAHRAASAQPATPEASPVAPGEIPISGDAVPELAAFDEAITSAMRGTAGERGAAAAAATVMSRTYTRRQTVRNE